VSNVGLTLCVNPTALIVHQQYPVHRHADPGWFLSVPAAIGAYGVLLNLETDALGIAASAPFYLVFNQELADAYTEGEPWKPEGCCHRFDIGHEWISDGNMPEGFSNWA